jgi:hypothetical protein
MSLGRGEPDGLRRERERVLIPGGNTNAPAVMIGEHCASLMGARLMTAVAGRLR